jgi:hypothetical protein
MKRGLVAIGLALCVIFAALASRQAKDGEPRRPLFSEEMVIVKGVHKSIRKAVFYTLETPEPRAWNYIAADAKHVGEFEYFILYPGSPEYAAAELVPLAERHQIPESFDLKSDAAPAASFDERFDGSRRKTFARADK